MNTLIVLLLMTISCAWAANSFGDPCYQCSDFNPQGQGFMAHPSTTMCCYYYECWRVDGSSTIDSHLRTCAPGTWFNPTDGPNGAPCSTTDKPYSECVDVCGSSTPVVKPICHLYPNPSNDREFGVLNPPPDGPWEQTGTCKEGFKFDHGSCTCIGNPDKCFCMLDFDLGNSFKDQSCHMADIQMIFTGLPTFGENVAELPSGRAAIFTGAPNNQHYNIPMFSGMYGCNLKCLSVGLFFNPDRVPAVDETFGLVDYGDCDSGSSYNIRLEGDTLIGSVGDSLTVTHAGIQANTWYYVSMVIMRKRRHDTLWLYVMTPAEAIECETNCNCPGAVDSDTRNPSECIGPGPCGLEVGSMSPDNYFEGSLSRIQVLHKCNSMVCEGYHCLMKGKRGRVSW